VQPRQIQTWFLPSDAANEHSNKCVWAILQRRHRCVASAMQTALPAEVAHHVHPSSRLRRRHPPAAGGAAASASPSHAIGGSPPASIWTRRTFPRSKSEPVPDSELMCNFHATNATRRSPSEPTLSSTNRTTSDITIEWAGEARKLTSPSWEYSTIHDEVYFGRYFASSAGKYTIARAEPNMQQHPRP